MRKLQGSSLWVVEVPLPEGLYRYAFLVDDTEWTPDPLSEVRMKDDFGMDSSLIVLINENEKGARL
jgi:1,4-alpha-glucan branching enzyme